MTIDPKVQRVLASYARAFLGAALALYLAGNRDVADLLDAGLAAVIPPLLRWLNPNDPSYGRGAPSNLVIEIEPDAG
jgi:hypothetical protein